MPTPMTVKAVLLFEPNSSTVTTSQIPFLHQFRTTVTMSEEEWMTKCCMWNVEKHKRTYNSQAGKT